MLNDRREPVPVDSIDVPSTIPPKLNLTTTPRPLGSCGSHSSATGSYGEGSDHLAGHRRRGRSPLKFLRQTFARSRSPSGKSTSGGSNSDDSLKKSSSWKNAPAHYRRGISPQRDQQPILEAEDEDEDYAGSPERLGIGESPFARKGSSSKVSGVATKRSEALPRHKEHGYSRSEKVEDLFFDAPETPTNHTPNSHSHEDESITRLIKGAYPDQFHHRSVNNPNASVDAAPASTSSSQKNLFKVVIPANEIDERNDDCDRAGNEKDKKNEVVFEPKGDYRGTPCGYSSQGDEESSTVSLTSSAGALENAWDSKEPRHATLSKEMPKQPLPYMPPGAGYFMPPSERRQRSSSSVRSNSTATSIVVMEDTESVTTEDRRKTVGFRGNSESLLITKEEIRGDQFLMPRHTSEKMITTTQQQQGRHGLVRSSSDKSNPKSVDSAATPPQSQGLRGMVRRRLSSAARDVMGSEEKKAASGTPPKPQRSRSVRSVTHCVESSCFPKTKTSKPSLWSKTRKGSEQGSVTTHEETSVVKVEMPFKIFLLLLEPRIKVFELIQLLYMPATTTIGDILAMIPHNATEKGLAAQRYKGLIRPTSQAKSWTDKNLHASASLVADSSNIAVAGIESGEIVVAIPYEYATKYVSRLARQILSNPRIQTLMHTSNTDQSGSNSVSSKQGRSSSLTNRRSSESPIPFHIKNQVEDLARQTHMTPVLEESPDRLKSPSNPRGSRTENEGSRSMSPSRMRGDKTENEDSGTIGSAATLASIAEAGASVLTTVSEQSPSTDSSAVSTPRRSPDSNKKSAEVSQSSDSGCGGTSPSPRPLGTYIERKMHELEEELFKASSFESLTEFRSAVHVTSPKRGYTARFASDVKSPPEHRIQTQSDIGEDSELLPNHFLNPEDRETSMSNRLGATASILPQGRYLDGKGSKERMQLGRFLDDRSRSRSITRNCNASVTSEDGTAYSVHTLNTLQTVEDSLCSIRKSRADHMPVFKKRTIGGRFDDDNISLDTSISSWSKSVDSSYLLRSRSLSRLPSPTRAAQLQDQQTCFRSQQRQKQRKLARKMRRFVAIGMAVMVCMYSLDAGNGAVQERNLDDPLGFVGLLQLLLSFAVLVKIQLFLRKRDESRCPFLVGCSTYAENFWQKSGEYKFFAE